MRPNCPVPHLLRVHHDRNRRHDDRQGRFRYHDAVPFLGGAITLASPISPPISTLLGFFNQFSNTNFVETSNVVTGGNDVISYTSTTSFTIYSVPSLTSVVATAVLETTDQVTVFGRTSHSRRGPSITSSMT